MENPPYKAGNRDLIPDKGTEVPHSAGQLNQQVTTRDLVLHNFVAETKARCSQINT